jgi:PAS domain-containing protein
VIATKTHRDGLARILEARGCDVTGAVLQGRYAALDADEPLSKFRRGDLPDAQCFVSVIGPAMEGVRAAAGGSRVVAFGEIVARLWAQRKSDAALHLEQLWNDLAQTQSFSLRCAYPIAGFSRESDGGPFLKICAAHSEVIPDESYTSLPSSEERLRSIGLLQQRAQALETEKADRQKAQAALRGKESELADVLENALEGAQQTGPNRKILWANRALSKLLGYDATEYIDHSFVDFFVERHIFEEYWQRLMRGEDVYDYPRSSLPEWIDKARPLSR